MLEQVAVWFSARSRDRSERAIVRKGSYWIYGVFPCTIYPYFMVWLFFFGSLTLNVKELLLQCIGNQLFAS